MLGGNQKLQKKDQFIFEGNKIKNFKRKLISNFQKNKNNFRRKANFFEGNQNKNFKRKLKILKGKQNKIFKGSQQSWKRGLTFLYQRSNGYKKFCHLEL